MRDVPAEFSRTPTYGDQPATPDKWGNRQAPASGEGVRRRRPTLRARKSRLDALWCVGCRSNACAGRVEYRV